MNYIYDIVLNFHEQYYQFFEWEKKDKIQNIIKIPIYRVTDKDIMNLKNNIIKVDQILIDRIKKDNKKNKKLICLVSNTQITLGLLFDIKGNLLKRSSLIYEEEDEANDLCKNLKTIKIRYIENKEIPPRNILRLELEKKDNIINYINKLNDISTLKYLYYEYFKNECNDKETIKKSLIKELEKTWTKNQNNLYYIVKILIEKDSLIK